MKHQAGYSAGAAIQRDNMFANLSVANGGSMSNAMDFQQYAGGNIITPLTLNANTVLGFMIAEQEAGPYYPLYDEYGQLVYIPVSVAASRAYVLPTALFGACFVKVWTCTTAGVSVAQTGDKGFTVMMKG
jgi:hypothetical protein